MSQEEASGAEKVALSAAVGALVGALYGTAEASWTDKPAIVRGQYMPGIASSVSVIAKNAGMLAAVGATFAAAEHTAKSVRGVNDKWNNAIAACAAGSLLGLKANKLSHSIGGCVLGGGASLFISFTDSLPKNTLKEAETKARTH